jgi:hypothetical protein
LLGLESVQEIDGTLRVGSGPEDRAARAEKMLGDFQEQGGGRSSTKRRSRNCWPARLN